MKALFDTNVILDLFLEREPFVEGAIQAVALVETSKLEGFLCATTVTTLDYVLSQSLPQKEAKLAFRRLLGLFEIAPVNRSILDQAMDSSVKDFEDAVLEQSALLVSADVIVTRNLKDFKKSKVPAFDPLTLLSSLNA